MKPYLFFYKKIICLSYHVKKITQVHKYFMNEDQWLYNSLSISYYCTLDKIHFMVVIVHFCTCLNLLANNILLTTF